MIDSRGTLVAHPTKAEQYPRRERERKRKREKERERKRERERKKGRRKLGLS